MNDIKWKYNKSEWIYEWERKKIKININKDIIDGLVYELYALTPDEIAIVEEGVG